MYVPIEVPPACKTGAEHGSMQHAFLHRGDVKAKKIVQEI